MSSKLSEQLKVIQLKVLTQTAGAGTMTGTGVAAGLSVHRGVAEVIITAVAGDSADRYVFTIQGSNTAIDSGFELAHASGEPATLTAGFDAGAQVAKIGVNPYKWYRVILVTTDGSADVTYVVQLWLQPSKLPAAAQILATA
ncbi:hypothetical protein LCGC14_1745530 [marine sediment metagenome]|uniref:Uncharacterized protein n=1 Tax=marine sediment metagenome TaxID=412755 RepID=A0A0F9K510_9ZZZZ